MRSDLFTFGDFTLHGGERSCWKIDCDALTDGDLVTLARMIADAMPTFGSVEGVPRGGLRIAEALQAHVTAGPLLIVDDVFTTGASMEAHRAGRFAIGAVIFARRADWPAWIRPLFAYGMW